MEFFASVPVRTDAGHLKSALTVAALPDWCASIDQVLDDRGDAGTDAPPAPTPDPSVAEAR